MVTAPQNLERIEQGGSHDLDITFLNRAASLGGTAINPDGYVSGDPGASVTATFEVYDATQSDPNAPANWSTPSAGLNPPTVTGLTDGGSTGRVLATVAAPANAKDSLSLLADDVLRWGIHWSTTINGVSVEFFEFVDIVAAGGAGFGAGLIVTAAEVRAASGFTDARDIDDDAVEAIIHRSQREFLHDVARSRQLVTLDSTNAAGTIFEVPEWAGYIVPDAFADLEDATAYVAEFLDSEDAVTPVGINSRDARRNRVTLASPRTGTDSVILTGWFLHTQAPSVDLAAECVAVLATHYIDLRAQEPGSIHLAATAGGRALNTTRDTTHLKEYRRLVARFLRNGSSGIGAASIDTAIGRRGGVV